ncbi:MAG: hypothetical protein GTN76_06505, partial [Candidatus Aenigmarchaeota archaeon]|nr:hypothetical protein [Candidatus Aenigmarchaeota archaeon]
MHKKQIPTVLIFAACYLIFSLPFVYAYIVGDYIEPERKVRMSVLQPTLHIVDDLKPIDCESSDYINFRMFIDNLQSWSNITNIEAYVVDLSKTDTKYDVTPSLLCTPKTNIISNEEISCHINIEELLFRIRACPLQRIDNIFEIYLDVQTEAGMKRLSGSKTIIITEAGIQPELKIDFNAVYPPMQIPRINCLTGSIIDVPVVLDHTEVFYGKTEWSLRINESQEFRELIECELTLEGDYRQEGKSDIYMCILTIPSTFFPTCVRGDVSVKIIARNGEHRIYDSFDTKTYSQQLNLGLYIEDLDLMECKIINENGTCIPTNPQQNITVTIVGNVPKYIEAFDFSYALGDENETDTYCRRDRYNLYECIVFITKDTLPMPSGTGTTTESRDLNFSMQIKHINYYQTLSETTTVGMEGTAIHDFLSAKKTLEEMKKRLEDWNKVKDVLEDAAWLIDFISLCCKIVNIERQLNDLKFLQQMLEKYGRTLPGVWGQINAAVAAQLKERLLKIEKIGEEIWVLLQFLQSEIKSIIMSAGPGIIGCIGEAALKAVDIEIENIEKFESGQINQPLDTPDNILDYLKSLVSCAAENFWDNIKSRWLGYLCAVAVFVVNIICQGCLTSVCKIITEIAGPLKFFITLALMIVNTIIMGISINMATEAISLAREEINILTMGNNALADYMENMKNTFLAIALAQVNDQLYKFIQPTIAADMVRLFFISSRTGILNYDDEICRGDSLTIEYNFE